jgi:hypothetical protein
VATRFSIPVAFTSHRALLQVPDNPSLPPSSEPNGYMQWSSITSRKVVES